jgi:hypothetical protein
VEKRIFQGEHKSKRNGYTLATERLRSRRQRRLMADGTDVLLLRIRHQLEALVKRALRHRHAAAWAVVSVAVHTI